MALKKKLSIFNNGILRVPALSSEASLKDHWADLKKMIAVSSPEFYQLISTIDYPDVSKLPEKALHTLWKYFNRARHRATPYGPFASIGLLQFDEVATDTKIILTDQVLQHRFTNWEQATSVNISVQEIISQDACLLSNSSYYILGSAIRYLSHLDGQFELSEIDLDRRLIAVLRLCEQPKRYSAIAKSLIELFNSASALEDCLQQLIDLQLLYSSLHPNIIGEEYFERVGKKNEPEVNDYLICERIISEPVMSKRDISALPGLVKRLSSIAPQQQHDDLNHFIRQFRQKFEMQEVPLLLALDPEAGIGYGALANASGSEGLAAGFARQIPEQEQKQSLKQFLNQQEGHDQLGTVLDLEQLPLSEQNVALSNSIGLLLSDADGLWALEAITGVTATSLIGRFTHCNDEIENMARQIAALEIKANADVIFFDIAYQGEPSVDNINRRRSIYDYQLSIIDYDTTSAPLCFDDLYLYLSGNDLILWSHRLGKRVVPRLATAYNYRRSDLAVFRFLCDLQHYGLQTALLPDFRGLSPGRNYFPRITYRNIIVSRAAWRIKRQWLENGQDDPAQSLSTHLNRLSVSRYFRAGRGDQLLHFDSRSNDDLGHFIKLLGKEQELIIEEAWAGADHRIIDKQQRPYRGEVLVTLFHENMIYPGILKTDHRPQVRQRRMLVPGKWLYFEIYTHPQRSDELLLGIIGDIIHRHQSRIKKWFFIRYNQNGDHLRLRIELKTKRSMSYLVDQLGRELLPGLQSGIIQDFNLRVYRRELERYGWAGIDKAEAHFYQDSLCVLALLAYRLNDEQLYCIILSTLTFIGDNGPFAAHYFTALLERISAALCSEHHLSAGDYKKLNTAYSQYRNNNFEATVFEECLTAFRSSLLSTLESCRQEKRGQLLADLMHMHINRIFHCDQRSHEMIIYYYALKEAKRQTALKVQEDAFKQIHWSSGASMSP